MTVNTKSQTVRAQLIASLEAKLIALNGELAKFTTASKAARAVQLRTEITEVSNRLVSIKLKAMNSARVAAELSASAAAHAPVDAPTEDIESLSEELRGVYDRMLGVMGMASVTRKLCSWALAVVASTALAYGVSMAIDFLVLGALALTGSAFLGLLIYVLGMILGVYATFKSFQVGYYYVAEKTVDDHANTMRGWFGFGPNARARKNKLAAA
jgi:hypothetical protein